jgi:alpha-beta hydrolase superfamily lysophospholipase
MTQPSKIDSPDILSLLFHPAVHPKNPLPENCSEHQVAVTGPDASIGCRLHSCGDNSAPLVVYFHGNGETVSDYDEIGSFYTGTGINVFFTSYRGYGWSSGCPSVHNMYPDSLTLLDFCTSTLRELMFSGPIFVMGRSLGCAAAIECAFRRPDDITGLIIESGFADTLPLLARLGLAHKAEEISEEDGFNNVAKIREISLPTLILHGSRDQLIPVHEAEKLQAESGAKTKQFFMIPGADHNSLIMIGGAQYFSTINKFVDTVTGKNTWRHRRKKFKQKDPGHE